MFEVKRTQGLKAVNVYLKYKHLKEFLVKDTAPAHLVAALIRTLRHWFSQAILSLLGTIIIAVLIGESRYDWLFWAVCILYFLLLVGIAFCKEYDLSIQKDLANENASLKEEKKRIEEKLNKHMALSQSLSVMHAAAGKDIYRIARQVKYQGWIGKIDAIREVFGFQKMCMQTCREVYRFCKQQHPEYEYYVTLFQRIEVGGKNKDKCRMIAFANKDGIEPLSYRDEYQITKGKLKMEMKVPLHTQIFAEDELKNYVISDPEEIKKKFVIHEKNKTREDQIKGYIGIPAKVCNRGVTFLLQIDCNCERGFGEDRGKAEELAEMYFKPYVSYLSMIYEFDRMNEMIDNRFRCLQGGGSNGQTESNS